MLRKTVECSLFEYVPSDLPMSEQWHHIHSVINTTTFITTRAAIHSKSSHITREVNVCSKLEQYFHSLRVISITSPQQSSESMLQSKTMSVWGWWFSIQNHVNYPHIVFNVNSRSLFKESSCSVSISTLTGCHQSSGTMILCEYKGSIQWTLI